MRVALVFLLQLPSLSLLQPFRPLSSLSAFLPFSFLSPYPTLLARPFFHRCSSDQSARNPFTSRSRPIGQASTNRRFSKGSNRADGIQARYFIGRSFELSVFSLLTRERTFCAPGQRKTSADRRSGDYTVRSTLRPGFGQSKNLKSGSRFFFSPG